MNSDKPSSGHLAPLRILTGTASLVVIILGLHFAAALLTQILIIAVITITISPIYSFLRRLKIPAYLSVSILIILLVGTATLFSIYLFPRSVMEFTKKVPSYHDQLQNVADDATLWLAQNDVSLPKNFLSDLVSVDPSLLRSLGKETGMFLLSFTKSLTIILIVVCFLIVELPLLPKHLASAKWLTSTRREILSRFVLDVRHYMGIKSVISLATGVCIFIGLRCLKVESAVLLGLVAFILNFVPGIGSVIAAIPGILIAMNGGGLLMGIWVGLLYLVVNQVIGNIIEPRVMGRDFGVPPAIVLISVLVWGWILGPVGMLFAVPLTMAVRSAIASSEHSR